jgi:2-polyprenyl-6-methoxyphenol hydroxylase-like FAD-dependent oxidoreductase
VESDIRRTVGAIRARGARLARCLEEVREVDVPSALRRYEELCRERVAWIVRRSRALGRIDQLENPILCQLRDTALKATPARVQLRQFERVMLYEERSTVR